MARPTPLLVFDGDCAFCTTWVRRLERILRFFPESKPWQWLDYEALGLSRHDVSHYVWFLIGDRRYRGHAAVAALLRGQRSAGWRFVGHLLVTPPFSWVAAVAYALIARFRHRLPGGTPACALEHGAEATSGLHRDASANARLGRRATGE